MFTGDGPIFQQLADRVAADIIAGTYPEESGVPSTNDYAIFYEISPITASKGINVLVEQGVLYKKRGIGMFVATDARELLRSRRRAEFREQYIAPLVREAKLLGLSAGELAEMINQEDNS